MQNFAESTVEEVVRNSVTIDWTEREPVRAKPSPRDATVSFREQIRIMVKRICRP